MPISSWWVNLFGHANPRINAALRAQLESLEHVILAGFTHEPVIRLSEALTAHRAGRTDALLLCGQWFRGGRSRPEDELPLLAQCGPCRQAPLRHPLGQLSRGDPRARSPWAMSSSTRSVYQPLLMDVITVPSPDAFDREPGVSEAEWAQRQFAHMERVLAEHGARSRRRDRRTAGAVRGRHAHV